VTNDRQTDDNKGSTLSLSLAVGPKMASTYNKYIVFSKVCFSHTRPNQEFILAAG